MISTPPSSDKYVGHKSHYTLNSTDRSRAVFIGAMAALASFEEIMSAPKPGLVDPHHAGSHSDMTWTTFLLSAGALAPYWQAQAAIGALRLPDDVAMRELRVQGVEMEQAMFGATGGVNTHKGLIFALSLLCGASGALAATSLYTVSDICRRAGEIAATSARAELEAVFSCQTENTLTHGQAIYLRHGVSGIRGEAMAGFPTVLELGLPAFEQALLRGASYNDAAISALLAIMTQCEDTNVIHRGGFGFWSGIYKERAADAFARFDPANPGDYAPVAELDSFLVKRSVSPGGAADLLVCTLFLHRSKITDNISHLRRSREQ